MKRPYFKKTDLLPIFVVLIVATIGAVFLISNKLKHHTPEIAEIRVNSVVVKTIDLREVKSTYNVLIEGNFPVTLEISKNGVKFTDSECNDKLCIHSGLIEAHESAACLPAGVSVTVKGSNSPDIDGIVG